MTQFTIYCAPLHAIKSSGHAKSPPQWQALKVIPSFKRTQSLEEQLWFFRLKMPAPTVGFYTERSLIRTKNEKVGVSCFFGFLNSYEPLSCNRSSPKAASLQWKVTWYHFSMNVMKHFAFGWPVQGTQSPSWYSKGRFHYFPTTSNSKSGLICSLKPCITIPLIHHIFYSLFHTVIWIG